MNGMTPQEDLSAMGPEEQLRAFSSVVLPEETETPLDIVAKMVIVLINLGAHHLVQVRFDAHHILNRVSSYSQFLKLHCHSETTK